GRNDILGKIRSESVDERGSDDLISVSEFRLSQPLTKVRTVVPLELSNLSGVVPVEVGETVVVRGVTNRNPESTEIEVRVTQGPSSGSFEEKTIRDWDTKTGTWSTVIDTEGVS
ncbi:MAG: hypothetical protein SV760_08885, partial [Halobacteria archaeon]|nr:hypothetical protein [Halobacteria archaeon]